jgi:hypothetical protein
VRKTTAEEELGVKRREKITCAEGVTISVVSLRL